MTTNTNEIPDVLKNLPNWVVWKYEVQDGRETKVPFSVKTGCRVGSDNPQLWTAFDAALTAADPRKGSEYEGIGFELGGTSLVGIDFDKAINKKGVVNPYVLAILKLAKSPYTETSPSMEGLHAFVECDALPAGGRKMSKGHEGVEIYHGKEAGRYFTVTGARVLGSGVPHLSADEIALVYLLITQNHDAKFKRLWLGDTSDQDGDDSSADFALLCRLADLTHNDAAKMEAYFSESGLGVREKWFDRDDYRERSINAAIETNKTGRLVLPNLIEFHSEAVPDPDGEYVLEPLEGRKDSWFPLGDISLVGGASGSGKTTLMFQLLHAQKRGQEFLGHKSRKLPFYVLAYDRGKNAFSRTLNRLGLASEDIPTKALPLAFGLDAVQFIVNEIESMDPRPSVVYLEGLDMLLDDANKKSIVAPFMRNLQEVAEHFHIALIGSLGAPKAKRGEDYAAKRDHLSGSEAWGRNCETVVVLEFLEDEDGTEDGRLLAVLLRNAKAEKFTMEFDICGRLRQVEHAEEEDADDKPAVDEKLQVAMDFLRTQLQKYGQGSLKSLKTRARELENISPATLYKAKAALHLETVEAAGQLHWRLPKPIEGVSYADDLQNVWEQKQSEESSTPINIE